MKITFILLLILVAFTFVFLILEPSPVQASFSCTNVIEIPKTECEALVLLFNSTNGFGWINKTNWLVTNTPSDWYGIYLLNGHVKIINLRSNHLVGHIPTEIANLTHVSDLLLANNEINGLLPEEMSNLTNLSQLWLEDNLLTGIIPSSFGELMNLSYLNLASNQLTGNIPIELGKLINLRQLYLSHNQLNGFIPPSLGNLVKLTYLGLDNNQLIGPIPGELSKCSLLSLALSNNILSGTIPVELSNLIYLQYFYLDHNQLTGSIPAEFGKLRYLNYLFLSNNNLSGSIPLEFGLLSYLAILDISSNPLTGTISSTLQDLSLYMFYIENTYICEPTDQDFLTWKGTIDDWKGTGVNCGVGTYIISGQVKDQNGIGMEAVTLTIAPDINAITDSHGFYSISIKGGSYTLTPLKQHFFFSQPYRNILLAGNIQIDFTGYPCFAPSGMNVCILQPGDIILSRSPTYAAIFSVGGTYFTHAALYLGMVTTPDGGDETIIPRLAEAQGELLIDALEIWETGFMNHPFWTGFELLDWAVVRPKTTTYVIDATVSFIRQKAIQSDVVFDILASRTDEKRFYCSGLVWRSYLDIPHGINLENNIGLGSLLLDYWVTPDDLFFSVFRSSSLVQYKADIDHLFKTMLWSPAHIMLVNPEGQRTGYDPVTRMILNEIPLATYMYPPDVQVETIAAPGVGEGWKVVVTGYDSGSYSLEYSYLTLGTLNIVVSGTTAPGQVDEYDIHDPIFGVYMPLVER